MSIVRYCGSDPRILHLDDRGGVCIQGMLSRTGDTMSAERVLTEKHGPKDFSTTGVTRSLWSYCSIHDPPPCFLLDDCNGPMTGICRADRVIFISGGRQRWKIW